MKSVFHFSISILAFLLTMPFSSCKKDDASNLPAGVPVLSTAPVTEQTGTSAISGGNITSEGSSSLTARGIIWSTRPNPTIVLNSKTNDGKSTGSFISPLVDLSPNTQYFVRAYASNSNGTAYGNEVRFTTGGALNLPVVTTTFVSGIGPITASSGGNITSDGGASIFIRGVCWSTSQNPTIALSTKTSDGSGLGSFTSSLTGLSPNTLYYVRAYATNSAGTAYGSQISFTTQAGVSLNIETSLIPAGTFTMGSPSTEPDRATDEVQHQVSLSAFRMSKYEISNAQYAGFLNTKGIGSDGIYAGGAYPTQTLIYVNSNWGLTWTGTQWQPVTGKENFPVTNVTWYGAAEFATYAGGRLPTEAEWEYACRGGTSTAFSTGACLYNTQANYRWDFPLTGCTNTSTAYPNQTQAVNSYSPNAYGLYNMHGNVWEWCADWYDAYPTTAQTNPTGPANGAYRVLRGGTWGNYARYCRSAERDKVNPDGSSSIDGFRLAFAP